MGLFVSRGRRLQKAQYAIREGKGAVLEISSNGGFMEGGQLHYLTRFQRKGVRDYYKKAVEGNEELS